MDEFIQMPAPIQTFRTWRRQLIGRAGGSVTVIEPEGLFPRRRFGKKGLFLSRQQSSPDVFAGAGTREVLALTGDFERWLVIQDRHMIGTVAAHPGFHGGRRAARDYHPAFPEIFESTDLRGMTEMRREPAGKSIFRRTAEARKSNGSVQGHASVTIAVGPPSLPRKYDNVQGSETPDFLHRCRHARASGSAATSCGAHVRRQKLRPLP